MQIEEFSSIVLTNLWCWLNILGLKANYVSAGQRKSIRRKSGLSVHIYILCLTPINTHSSCCFYSRCAKYRLNSLLGLSSSSGRQTQYDSEAGSAAILMPNNNRLDLLNIATLSHRTRLYLMTPSRKLSELSGVSWSLFPEHLRQNQVVGSSYRWNSIAAARRSSWCDAI